MGNQAGIIIRNVKNELFHSAKRLILNEVKGIECLHFTIDIDSLIGGLCKGKDLIVLKIGENVKDEDGYYAAFKHLTEYCLKFTDNVIVACTYWKAPKKEEAMVRVAREKNIKYVPLFWIYELYEDEVKAHVGDTIFNIKGKPYPIKTDFIVTHPNDKCMKMIADEIYKNIEL